MRENRPYGSEGGEQRYCSPTPIDKKRRAMCAAAWTPASAGATKVGSTPPRKGRALFEFGETQLHRRPGVGRDPDKKRRAMRAAAWTPASAGATKVGSTSPRKSRAL